MLIVLWKQEIFEFQIYKILQELMICNLIKFTKTHIRTKNYNRLQATVSPAITIDTILISLISILSDGPEVSLKGSPTVSPTTAALCASLPLPPKFPSQYTS